jgi:hypothetical protein
LSSVDAAYLAGLIDGEGTTRLSRKHAGEKRQLVVSISNTELPLLAYAVRQIGAGKITTKKTASARHATAYTFAVWNRQAPKLLFQIEPFLRSYERRRAALVLTNYVRLTPRNGKYTSAAVTARLRFEEELRSLRAHGQHDATAEP